MKKIVVVGVGNVGINYINNIVCSNIGVTSIVLIDIDRKKAIGEAMDLSHAKIVLNNNIDIKVGDYKDCFDADIVVIAAGDNQKGQETRLDLINRNKDIIESIVTNVMRSGFNGIFLVATNPVDVMAYYTKKVSHLPGNKVIGTGTMLDTARLKYLLSKKVSVNPNNIHAYVLGEHGDSSFVLWSKSTIGTVPIKESISKEDLDAIENEVRTLAYTIISNKGYTSEGVAACLYELTKVIINDENKIYNVSCSYNDIYISMPSVIGKDGVKGTVKMELDEEEKEEFEKSTNVIKTAINELEELL